MVSCEALHFNFIPRRPDQGRPGSPRSRQAVRIPAAQARSARFPGALGALGPADGSRGHPHASRRGRHAALHAPRGTNGEALVIQIASRMSQIEMATSSRAKYFFSAAWFLFIA